MTARGPLPSPFDDRPFDVADALANGVTASRLRSFDLERPFHGVRGIALGDDTLARARAYAVRMPATQFFTHLTAAFIHDLRIARRWDAAPLHVGVIWPRRAPRGRGVIGHETRDRVRVHSVGGLRTVSAVTAWCQSAALLSLDELIVAGDGLLRRQDPEADLDELMCAVTRWSGGRGTPKLRAALPHLRARSDSARETMLRLLMIRARLPEPEINPAILDSSGTFLAFGDLAYPEYRVLVEYDGEQHRLDEQHYQRDIDRLDRLMQEGWRVVRVNKGHMAATRRGELVIRIARALMDGGWDGRCTRSLAAR